MKSNHIILKITLPAVVLALALMATFPGGAPAKKILPPPGPGPRMAPEPYPTKNPAGTSEEKTGLNRKLTDAVNTVRDVKRSTVLVIGTSAYAGLDINAGVEGARLQALRERVETVIKETEPRIRTVWTAVHPATFRRIDRVRAAIRAGKPASAYASDLRSIINESDLVK